jgi:hypothetical protein
MKIKISDSPTERTTAATDILLGIQTVGCAWYIYSMGQSHDPWKATIWTWGFVMMALAAFGGTIAHGFQMSKITYFRVWRVLGFILAMIVPFFLTGVVYDLWGYDMSRFALPMLIAVGVIVYVVTLAMPATFMIFIVYESVALLCALLGYGWLTFMGQPGTAFIVGGILIILLAAVIQATEKLRVTLIWEFDFNSFYHVLQIAANFLIVWGLSF